MTDQMFTTREVPWMKLGRIENEAKTAADAAKLGGLDFTVSLKNVMYEKDETTNERYYIPGRKAIVRDDTGAFMGFASSKIYRSLQYADAFEFMNELSPRYVAAGTLRSGRQGFMVVKLDNVGLDVLKGEDPHDFFAVLRTSHDCSRGIEVSCMPLRGRCMNQLTLNSFSKNAQYRWSFKHTTTMAVKMAEAKESMLKLGLYAQRFQELATRLVNTAVKPDNAKQLLEITIPMPKSGKTDKTEIQYAERIESILNLWSSSPTVAYAGTGWGLVNAVSEYFDWLRPGGTPESRFINALEGQTHKRVNKIAGLLLAA